MSKDYFSNKAKHYEKNSKRVTNVSNIADAIKNKVTFTSDMKLMDFGSGTGLLLERIAPLVQAITAVDISTSMMTQLEAKKETLSCELETRILDLETNSIDQKFDGIISSMTLHHIKNVPSILKKLFDLLNPGGFIAIADLDSEDGSFHDENTGVHHNGFERTWLAQEAQAAGFEKIVIDTASELSKPQGNYTIFLLSAYKA
jgi:2-polyprenyl-3-methyl-5-hydroxy-6-metoxy-1,4-benzoquinol methylase